uniref:Putative secreted protein n=1 Tax=Ixodes ricinus TaxID=34613 RepID=A0A6B0TYC7_IXORI
MSLVFFSFIFHLALINFHSALPSSTLTSHAAPKVHGHFSFHSNLKSYYLFSANSIAFLRLKQGHTKSFLSNARISLARRADHVT